MNSKIDAIIQIAKDVYKTLGSGFSEDVYDKAMQVGLRLQGFKYESQKVIELKYKGLYVGAGYPDIIVHVGKEKIILELKAVGSKLGYGEEQQIKNYMRILDIKTGVLINFQQPKKEGKTQIEIKSINI